MYYTIYLTYIIQLFIICLFNYLMECIITIKITYFIMTFNLPKTITKVILTVLTLARGIKPLELALLLS